MLRRRQRWTRTHTHSNFTQRALWQYTFTQTRARNVATVFPIIQNSQYALNFIARHVTIRCRPTSFKKTLRRFYHIPHSMRVSGGGKESIAKPAYLYMPRKVRVRCQWQWRRTAAKPLSTSTFSLPLTVHNRKHATNARASQPTLSVSSVSTQPTPYLECAQ